MDDEEKTLFPTRLRYLRQKNGLSQKALAEKLNYRYTAISNYENGKNEPGLNDLMKLARAFGVSVDFLIGYSNNTLLNDEAESFCGLGIKRFIDLYIHHEESRQYLEAIINGMMNLLGK